MPRASGQDGTTSLAISRDLEDAILTGDYPDGYKLDETCLSEKYAVSRTPVREALRMLSSTGLVDLVPNRGAFVKLPTIAEIVEMFEVMAELEALAARLAARRATSEQLQALEEAHRSCARAREAADPNTYFSENERFHQMIYEASGNSYLQREAQALFRLLQPIRRIQLQARGRLSQSMDEHGAILTSLISGDGEEAARLLRSHIIIQGEKFNDVLAGITRAGLSKTA
ncbi:MAG: GntR family transcriptional regulator [Pseudomonadota bacterium]